MGTCQDSVLQPADHIPHLSHLDGRPFLPPSTLPSVGILIPTNVLSNSVATVTSVHSAKVTIQPTNVLNTTSEPSPIGFYPLPSHATSPVHVSCLSQFLAGHPNQTLVKFLVQGFSFGFDIGFVGRDSPGQARNLLSARSNPLAVQAAIAKEIARKHTSGPFVTPPFTNLHCSPLGAVPKKDGTFRIILDLSSPKGSSINEGISSEAFSVRYSSFDDAIDMVQKLGKGCSLAKIDIKHAFRICPVRPKDWHLLGFYWESRYFVDIRLPFGSRSSPYIFNQFAEALLWILVHVTGISWLIHYLDDFLLGGVSASECVSYMGVMFKVCSELGVPIAEDKTVGPSTMVTYLGIEIDTQEQTIRLPVEKLTEIKLLLHKWGRKKKCTKRELLSLIGSLSFACKVVKPGRMFLRRLIDLSTTVSHLNYHISLNSEAKLDIKWWSEFIDEWNGCALFQAPLVTSLELNLFTDASNSGLGAVYGAHWFSEPWPARFLQFDINYRELFAIVAAVFTWGNDWCNRQVLFYTDNLVISKVWVSGSCRNKDIMALVRSLFMFSSQRNINILIRHIPGSTNVLADALSRLQVVKFKQLHRQADPTSTVVQPSVWQL